jgi:hypothetical protein
MAHMALDPAYLPSLSEKYWEHVASQIKNIIEKGWGRKASSFNEIIASIDEKSKTTCLLPHLIFLPKFKIN